MEVENAVDTGDSDVSIQRGSKILIEVPRE